MFLNWDVGIIFILHVLITIGLIVSYIYFIFFQKEKPSLDELPPALLLNRSTQEWWLWLTRPLEKRFIKKDTHPNTVGLIAFLMMGLSLICFSFGWFMLGGWCILLASAFDIFNRRLSKKLGLLTQNRLFLNAHLDLLGESLMFLGILDYYANTLFFYVVFIAFLSSILISFSDIREEVLGVSAKIHMIERFERILWIGLTAIVGPLVAAVANTFFPISSTWLSSVVITIVAILGAHSCYQWFDLVYKKLK